MPTILEQLAEQMKLARRGMEGEDDTLTRHPVRRFCVIHNENYRSKLFDVARGKVANNKIYTYKNYLNILKRRTNSLN